VSTIVLTGAEPQCPTKRIDNPTHPLGVTSAVLSKLVAHRMAHISAGDVVTGPRRGDGVDLFGHGLSEADGLRSRKSLQMEDASVIQAAPAALAQRRGSQHGGHRNLEQPDADRMSGGGGVGGRHSARPSVSHAFKSQKVPASKQIA
jgi:hypothetical protein